MKIIIFLLGSIFAHGHLFAQFSATMKNMVSGSEQIYQVYSDGENYRYEFIEESTEGIVLVKPTLNQTSILMPDNKFVHHTTCDDRMSRMNDPVQAAYWFKQAGEEKKEGEEKIGEYVCQKIVLFQGDKKVFTLWQSDQLNFPIKIENHYSKNTHMELVDIKEWKVNTSYFVVPADYTEVDDQMRPLIPEPPPPESWVTKKMSLPINAVFKRGDKLMFDIEATENHKLIAKNNASGPAKFIRKELRDGSELPEDEQGPVSYRTKRIFNGEKISNTFQWKAGSQVIIEVYEGELHIEVRPE